MTTMSTKKPAPRPRTGTFLRPPEAGWLQRSFGPLEALRDRLLEVQALWLVVFLAIGTWVLTPRAVYDDLDPSDWVPGAIAARDLEAPADFTVEDVGLTEGKRARAREEVLPVYDLDSGRGEELSSLLAALFATGRQLLAALPAPPEGALPQPGVPSRETTITEALLASTSLRVEPEDLALLRRSGFSAELEDRMRAVVEGVYREGVVSNKELLLENRMRGVTVRDLATDAERLQVDLYSHLGYPQEVRTFLDSEVRLWPQLGTQGRRRLGEMLFRNVAPDLAPNQSETKARQQAAAAAVLPVSTQVRKGQVLIRKGDEVSAFVAQSVAEIARRRAPRGQVLPILGSFLLLSLSALFLWSGLKGERVADHSRQRRFNEGLLVLLASVLGTNLCFLLARGLEATVSSTPFDSYQSYVYAIPFAGLAVVVRLLYTRNVALVLSLVFAVLVSRLAPEDGSWMLIYCLGGSLTAVAVLDVLRFKQRLVMTRVGALVGLANVVLILVITSLSPEAAERGLGETAFDLVCGFSGGLILAGVASFAVPILESLFCLTTDIKLVELSNTNLPLLRRLAFDAPGSFQHSLMVANLTKAGCEAIDADSVLAYAGGLYHDIGKMERPEYFIENQGRNRGNPHDKLQPSMSALVIINHVKKGLSLAREHNLPQPLRNAIAQHHGTRRLGFFYAKAVEKAGTEEVCEDDYRYPGPKPATKEMGVLMLADGVEAASRTLDEPTDVKIRSVVQKIVEDCLQDGQLDESPLTLSDIRRVSEAFHRVLSNIYHRRIDYPGFDFNRSGRKADPVTESAASESQERPRAVKAS
jgi:cyclic-di-AMP phosphodiesterase PgpH